MLKPFYELGGRDGIKICDVASEKAENGIQAGRLELWEGRHGAYLRSVGLAYPEDGSRRVSVAPDSRHTLHGTEPAAAANQAVLFRHNQRACLGYDHGRHVRPEMPGEFSRHESKLTAREQIRAFQP